MKTNLINKSSRVLLVALAFCGFSCEKEYLEIVPVTELQRDISISGAGDIKFLEFQDAQVGFAADSVNIYKTVNSCSHWQPVTTPPAAGNITNLVFFNQTSALCLKGGKVFATSNSGQTWTFKDDADFIGISAQRKGVYGKSERIYVPNGWESYYTTVCRVFVSGDQGNTFVHFKNIATDEKFVTAGFVTGNKVLVATEDINFKGYLFGLDLETAETGLSESFAVSGLPAQITFYDNLELIVSFGVTAKGTGDRYFSATHRHVGGYKSASANGDLIVGVGHHSIIANLDTGTEDFFTELLDANGKPFLKEFYKVQAVSPRSFYVGGENGLIWEMSI